MLKTYSNPKPKRIDYREINANRYRTYRRERAWNELDRGHDEYDHLCELFGGHTCEGYKLALN